MSANILSLLNELADSVARLRQSLQNPLLTELEDVLTQAQNSLDAVNAWPGGSDSLQAAIEALPESERTTANQRLQQAREDHAVNAELLQLAMQRNASLQAEAARSAENATYSSEGGFQMDSPGRLLGRF
jgi:hypothetical protein